MAYVFFKRRPKVSTVKSVAVTITGSGYYYSSYAYATINGTEYTDAASGIEVMAGDIITFGVYGYNSSNYGAITINGTRVLTVTNKKTLTYDWTVPDGITSVTIELSIAYDIAGRITVTTS